MLPRARSPAHAPGLVLGRAASRWSKTGKPLGRRRVVTFAGASSHVELNILIEAVCYTAQSDDSSTEIEAMGSVGSLAKLEPLASEVLASSARASATQTKLSKITPCCKAAYRFSHSRKEIMKADVGITSM
jgi:hypothetical protein